MNAPSTTSAIELREASDFAVLYVGTTRNGRTPVADRLSKSGLAVTRAGSLAEALQALASQSFAACLVDLSEDHTAVPWIRAIRGQSPQAAVIGVTDPSSPLSGADAMNAGASDVLAWPFHEAEVTALVANLYDQAAASHPGAEDLSALDHVLIAHSPAMRQVADLVRAAATRTDAVWLSGEAGSGRETVGRAVHAASPRAHGPIVVLDCAEGSPDDLDVRLFGVAPEEPAVGKARAMDRIGPAGALHRAQGGTLFLRRVTAAPARVQAKLARLLRDGEAQSADTRAAMALDVRLFVAGEETAAASHAGGQLRRELYDRVSQIEIEVPPLRRRREDIPVLAVSLLGELCHALRAPRQQFSRAALTVLGVLPWPGNGRELRHLVETLVRSVEHPVIQLEDVLGQVKLDGAAPRVDAAGSLREARAHFEREWISASLMKHQGRVEDAAKALGIQRTNLYRKIRQLNVPRALLVRKS
jgi:DNA-binding NtrC family response regulator